MWLMIWTFGLLMYIGILITCALSNDHLRPQTIIWLAFSVAVVMFIPLAVWQSLVSAPSGQSSTATVPVSDESYRAYQCSDGCRCSKKHLNKMFECFHSETQNHQCWGERSKYRARLHVEQMEKIDKAKMPYTTSNLLNVLVAIRDRDQQLQQFIHKIRESMAYHNLTAHIYVVEQTHDDVWNKGLLFNAAFLEASKEVGPDAHWLFSDVDIFDKTLGAIQYQKCRKLYGVHHLYGLPWCLGGVFCLNSQTYLRTNGFSNRFWGWGAEDRDFQNRVTACEIPVSKDGGFLERFPRQCEKTMRELVQDLPQPDVLPQQHPTHPHGPVELPESHAKCAEDCFHGNNIGNHTVCTAFMLKGSDGECGEAKEHVKNGIDCTWCRQDPTEETMWNAVARFSGRRSPNYNCNTAEQTDGVLDARYTVVHREEVFPDVSRLRVRLSRSPGAKQEFRQQLVGALFAEIRRLENWLLEHYVDDFAYL